MRNCWQKRTTDCSAGARDLSPLIYGLVALALSLSMLFAIDRTSLGAFTPDTADYLSYDSMRQPLYGLWANSLFKIFGDWRAVGYAQLLVLVGALTWYYSELLLHGLAGRVAVVICSIGVFFLLKLGVAPLIVILMTEGLFFSGLVLLAALAVRASRKHVLDRTLLAMMLILFLMTQLRPAALLTLAIPVAVLFVWTKSSSGSRRLPRALLLIAAYVVLLSLGPMALGKKAFQLGAPGEALGFTLLPRVGQLPLNPSIEQVTLEWRQLAHSWQSVAETLDLTESVLFDAQIQEAIRFELAPKVLFRSIASRSRENGGGSFWKNADAQIAARGLAIRWIEVEPRAYIYWSTLHFLGTLTAATFASDAQRLRVWRSVRAVDERVWQLAALRDDYPNNSFARSLKGGTALMYTVIRVLATLMFAGGAFAVVLVTVAILRKRTLHPSVCLGGYGFAWIALHALAVGLTSFPEFRFVYVTLWGYLFFGTAAIAALSVNKARERVSRDLWEQSGQ